MIQRFLLLTFTFFLLSSVSGQLVRLKIDDRSTIFLTTVATKYDIDLPIFNNIQPISITNILPLINAKAHLFNQLEQAELQHFVRQYDFLFEDNENSTDNDKVQVDSFFYYNQSTTTDEKLLTKQKPILKYFYENRNHLLSIDKQDFKLRLNPILDLTYGNASNDDNVLFKNTRGVEASVLIDKKVYIYTSIFENQARFMNYVHDYIDQYNAVPGNGLYKSYRSGVFDKVQGLDYLNSKAFINLPISKSIHMEFGHGNHFLGEGMRSVLLSDFSNNYLYLKLNAQFWKFHYQTIYAELNAVSANSDHVNRGIDPLPKKYTSNHYLSFKPNSRFEIGIFESVIFARTNIIELQYLNPVIFYRTVEQFINSPDNVLLGLNTSFSPTKKLRLYGQFLLDEFNLPSIKDDFNYWANKYGIQVGSKWFSAFGIENLDLQVEYNQVRPYTYSHYQSIDTITPYTSTSYSHYNMALAHPLGANFREILIAGRYAFNPKLKSSLNLLYYARGQDVNGLNYGSNILLNYNTRVGDNNILIGQGDFVKTLNIRGSVGYEFFPNTFADLNFVYRKNDQNQNSLYLGIGIRMNAGGVKFDF